MRALALLSVLALAACSEVSLSTGDGGIVTVPGSFHVARATPGHRAHFLLTGKEQVRCRDCHGDPDAGTLTAFERPSVQICASCHQKQESQHHPFTTDGGVTSCFTCHVFRTDQPVARFEKWACRDCHQNEVHLAKCESCHRPHQQPFTEAANCIDCHRVELSHGKAPALVANAPPPDASFVETCQSCHQPHTPAVQASQQCLSCHAGTKVPITARVSPQTLFMNAEKKGHLGCGTCHPTHAFDTKSVKACASCHVDRPVLAADAHVKCTSCHEPHQPRAAPKPCASCHQKIASAIGHPPSATGQTCIGCHPPHAPPDQLLTTTSVGCLSCHRDAKFASDVVHAVTTSCDACHGKHAAAPRRATLCVSCHAEQVQLVKLNAGHAKCDDCHAGLPHDEPPEPKACLECHEDRQPPQPGHATRLICASCHQSHSAKVIATCRDCHLDAKKPPLPGLHVVKEHRECKSCHAPHTPEPSANGPAMCLTCHQRPSQKNHPTPPKQCVGCHLFKPE